MSLKKYPAFTLSELLIALAILGIIATFTIPKVLQSQQDGKYKAMGKEAAAMLAGALMAYKQTNSLSPTDGADALTPYFNYVRIATSGTVDDVPTGGSETCSVSEPCYMLHNGGALWFQSDATITFGGTATTNAIYFVFDPDGKESGGQQPQGIEFWLYTNGRITTRANVLPDTTVDISGTPTTITAVNVDPPWFEWD